MEALPNRQYYLVSRVTVTVRHPISLWPAYDPNLVPLQGIKIPEQSEFEARESKRLVEGWNGAPLSSFCYPFYWSHGYLADAVKAASIVLLRFWNIVRW